MTRQQRIACAMHDQFNCSPADLELFREFGDALDALSVRLRALPPLDFVTAVYGALRTVRPDLATVPVEWLRFGVNGGTVRFIDDRPEAT